MTEQLKKINPGMGVAIKKATEVGMTLRKHMGDEKFAADSNPLKTFRDRIHEKSYDQGVKETTEKLNTEWQEKYDALKSKKGADVDLTKFVAKNIPFDAVKEIAAEFGFEVEGKKFKESLRQLVYIGMELAAGKMVSDLQDAELEEEEEEFDEEPSAKTVSAKKVIEEDPIEEVADETEDSGEWDGLGDDDDVSPETAKLLKVFESEMEEEEIAPRVTPMKPKAVVKSAKDFLDAFDMED